jgi:group I intron endonuclease
MENKYYIYFHINPLKNEVFYVGKGFGRRAYKKTGRSNFWNNTVNKYGYIVDIVESGLTEEEAHKREIFYISKIGRRDLGNGELINLTDGGEGTSGHKLSEEGLNKIREARKKQVGPLCPAYGKKLSETHKAKMQKALKERVITKEERELRSINSSGEGNSFFGRKHSDETKAIQSAKKIGKKMSDETKAKISEANKKPKSDEAKKNMSLARKGIGLGRPAHNKGKPHSEEQKQKLKDAWVKRKLKAS